MAELDPSTRIEPAEALERATAYMRAIGLGEAAARARALRYFADRAEEPVGRQVPATSAMEGLIADTQSWLAGIETSACAPAFIPYAVRAHLAEHPEDLFAPDIGQRLAPDPALLQGPQPEPRFESMDPQPLGDVIGFFRFTAWRTYTARGARILLRRNPPKNG